MHELTQKLSELKPGEKLYIEVGPQESHFNNQCHIRKDEKQEDFFFLVDSKGQRGYFRMENIQPFKLHYTANLAGNPAYGHIPLINLRFVDPNTIRG